MSVSETGLSEPVFNLAVAGVPEYFANGVLVHNCDAAIYARRKALHRWARDPDPEKPRKGSAAALDLQANEDEERIARRRTPEEEWFSEGDEDYDGLFRENNL